MPLPEPPDSFIYGQTPGWPWLRIRHLPSREYIEDVIEARAGPPSGPHAGWVFRKTGRLTPVGAPELERVVCACRIEWDPQTPHDAVPRIGPGNNS